MLSEKVNWWNLFDLWTTLNNQRVGSSRMQPADEVYWLHNKFILWNRHHQAKPLIYFLNGNEFSDILGQIFGLNLEVQSSMTRSDNYGNDIWIKIAELFEFIDFQWSYQGLCSFVASNEIYWQKRLMWWRCWSTNWIMVSVALSELV